MIRLILITGAKGSIGSALHRARPDAVGIDAADWDVRFPYYGWVDPYKPDLVYHLAASKDAPEGEVDPRDVLLTNALGTLHVLERWPTAKVVLASTCKAANPETAYGASKLIAERLVLNAGGWVARFHNVIETRGNVFETWAATDGPLPVTDCYRFFIHIQQAVDLLLAMPSLPPGRYMTEPPPIWWVPDMAANFYPGRELTFIPRRRGDRVTEPLVASHESIFSTQYQKILRITSPHD